MVSQYPDTVTVTRKPEFTKTSGGDFVAGASVTPFTSEGRAEPAGSNPVIKGVDGDDVIYTWVVYMPKTSEVFAFGDLVTITKADGSIFNSSVKRQYNGQFNSRLWV